MFYPRTAAALAAAVLLALPAASFAKPAAKQPAQKAAAPQYTLEQATAAYQKRDFQTAFKILSALANQGNAMAQNNLAVLYQDGLGTKADSAAAFKWYKKAAMQGHAEAQFMTGLMYSEGNGTAQNYAEAAKWYKKAALQNHPEAQNNLAARYATGTGVKRDLAEAKKWYAKAAANGNRTAAFTLKQLEQQTAVPAGQPEKANKGSLKK